jgi:hypothetical protein
MPNGEWVKFDFYFKVSPYPTNQGIVKVWVNDVLRWDHSGINTVDTQGSYFSGWLWWLQGSSGPQSNEPGVREGQERYLAQFRIGPGAMVLSEQG